jgi:hypothetical protein
MPTRYSTLKELKEAIDSGQLILGDEKLMIDNDCITLAMKTGPDDLLDYEEVFDLHPHEVLEQALDLLGIPNEPV